MLITRLALIKYSYNIVKWFYITYLKKWQACSRVQSRSEVDISVNDPPAAGLDLCVQVKLHTRALHHYYHTFVWSKNHSTKCWPLSCVCSNLESNHEVDQVEFFVFTAMVNEQDSALFNIVNNLRNSEWYFRSDPNSLFTVAISFFPPLWAISTRFPFPPSANCRSGTHTTKIDNITTFVSLTTKNHHNLLHNS